jgi:hypothetical protein
MSATSPIIQMQCLAWAGGMLARIWGHMHVASVKKDGPASEETVVLLCPLCPPPVLNQIGRRDTGAPDNVLSGRFGAGAAENGDWELCCWRRMGPGRNWTYLAKYARAAVFLRIWQLRRFRGTYSQTQVPGDTCSERLQLKRYVAVFRRPASVPRFGRAWRPRSHDAASLQACTRFWGLPEPSKQSTEADGIRGAIRASAPSR